MQCNECPRSQGSGAGSAMRRVLLFFAGIVLGLVAEIILWQAVSLHSFEDGWHSAAFTSIVGMAVIIEGILCALVAAVCLGRAVSPLIVAPALHDPRWPEPMSAAS